MPQFQTAADKRALRAALAPRTRREAGIMLDDITEDRGAGLISAMVLLLLAILTAGLLWGACVLLFSVDEPRVARMAQVAM